MVPEPQSYPPGALEAPSKEEKAAIAELGPMDGCEGRFPTSSDETSILAKEKKPVANRKPAQIQEAVRSHASEFRGCYEPRLRFNPALDGLVLTKFVILPSGEVANVHLLEVTIPDCFVPSCLVDVFEGMQFGPAEGVTTVTYPLRMSPG